MLYFISQHPLFNHHLNAVFWVTPCSFLICPCRVCHVLAGNCWQMLHWYISPAKCFASTWLLRLEVTLAVKLQVVQLCTRCPVSSKDVDIWPFTISVISAQKPESKPEDTNQPCLESIFGLNLWNNIYYVGLHVVIQPLGGSCHMRAVWTGKLETFYVVSFNMVFQVGRLSRVISLFTFNTLPYGSIELVHSFSHQWTHHFLEIWWNTSVKILVCSID